MALIISGQIIILIHLLDIPMVYASDNTSRFIDDIAFVIFLTVSPDVENCSKNYKHQLISKQNYFELFVSLLNINPNSNFCKITPRLFLLLIQRLQLIHNLMDKFVISCSFVDISIYLVTSPPLHCPLPITFL